MEGQAPPGLFLDPSEYRRLNFSFGDPRLTAVADLAASGKANLLSTDVAMLELKRLVSREIADALDSLKGAKVAVLKAVDDARMDVIRTPPSPEEISETVLHDLDAYLSRASCMILGVSQVNAMDVFDDYFHDRPPFDRKKKKNEFPDAFTLRRLLNWARDNVRKVYVVGPDPDLKHFCEIADELEYVERIELFLSDINRLNVFVEQMMAQSGNIAEQIARFVEDNFSELSFELKFNPHGEVSPVTVTSVEVTDIHALQVSDGSVQAEADVTVCFVADFAYDDYDTASYDRESDTWFFLKTVEGEADDCVELPVGFVFEVEVDGQIVVSDIEWLKETVVVKEEDRGDYDQYK
jgi:PIN domain